MYMEEWESLCFLAVPVSVRLPHLLRHGGAVSSSKDDAYSMQDLSQLYKSALFINDFAMHDSSRDLVLANTQQAAELRLLLSKVTAAQRYTAAIDGETWQEAEKAAAMRQRNAELALERQRTDEIVYQLLPKAVADQLRSGADRMSTCQVLFVSFPTSFSDLFLCRTSMRSRFCSPTSWVSQPSALKFNRLMWFSNAGFFHHITDF